jgi:hypothetical protein
VLFPVQLSELPVQHGKMTGQRSAGGGGADGSGYKSGKSGKEAAGTVTIIMGHRKNDSEYMGFHLV